MSDRCRIKYIYEIEWCCKKMEKYYRSHDDIKLDGESSELVVDGNRISQCPFCHTDLEVESSVTHY